MIRLTRCTQPSKAGTYFRLHLQGGDNPRQPAAPALTLQPGWIGPALADVGLTSHTPPTARHLVRLGRGLHPSENQRLAPNVNRKRAYYDLTISAPKTVSIAALLLPNHTIAKAIMRAHMAAVEVVARAAGGMIQPQKLSGPPAATWLGALFHHTHSREADPHLHTHIIFPNLMRNREGRWRAMQINISGVRRTKLELLYGHTLATKLRHLGFGPEIAMRPGGLPELRSLQSLIGTFSKARAVLLGAPTPTQAPDSCPETHRRSQLPRHPERAQIQRRQRTADQTRKPKRKASDDPIKLSEEAQRWGCEISSADYRKLTALLDALDYSNPRGAPAPIRHAPPPPARRVVEEAVRRVPEGVRVTGPVIFRNAIVLSAGRHAWAELLAETRAKLARRKKALARIRAEWEAQSVAQAQAEIEAANRAHRAGASGPARQPAPPTAPSPGQAQAGAGDAPARTDPPPHAATPPASTPPAPPKPSRPGRRR